MLLIVPGKLRRNDRLSVFHNYMASADLRELLLPDRGAVVDGDRDDRAVRLGGKLEAALMEREHVEIAVVAAAGSLRKDADGDAGFDELHTLKDSLERLLQILPVHEQTVQESHPGGQKRNLLHGLLCHIAGQAFTAGIGEQDVEVAAVISDIEHRPV